MIEGSSCACSPPSESSCRRRFAPSPHDEAMSRYGSDKPNLRFGFDVATSATSSASGFQVFRGADRRLRADDLRARRREPRAHRSPADRDRASQWGARHGIVCVEEARCGPIVKFLSEGRELVERAGGEPGDLIVFAADQPAVAAQVLGALRAGSSRACNRHTAAGGRLDHQFRCSRSTPDGQATYGHNPFSLPTEETMPLLKRPPGRARCPVRPGAERLSSVLATAQSPGRCSAPYRRSASASASRVLRLLPGALSTAPARRHRYRPGPPDHAAGR